MLLAILLPDGASEHAATVFKYFFFFFFVSSFNLTDDVCILILDGEVDTNAEGVATTTLAETNREPEGRVLL